MSTLPYEEIEDSPKITMDRKGGTGTRRLRIAWADIGIAIAELFPGSLFGFPYSASMPGFPWLHAQSVEIAAFDPNTPSLSADGSTSTFSTGAVLTVQYAPNQWQDDKKDKEKPEDKPFMEHNVSIGGEFLTWPNQGVKWSEGLDGSAFEGSQNDKRFGVFADVKVGIVIPLIEHTWTWHYVASPPWDGIRNCVGKVNDIVAGKKDGKWGGCWPETLLFLGATASRTFSTTGFPWWKLGYRFSEKCFNFPIGKKWDPDKKKFVDDPNNKTAKGWNHFLRPRGNLTSFERMVRGDNTPIYRLAQFRQLFGGPP